MIKIILALLFTSCSPVFAGEIQQSSKYFICKIKSIPGVSAEAIRQMKIKAKCPQVDIDAD